MESANEKASKVPIRLISIVAGTVCRAVIVDLFDVFFSCEWMCTRPNFLSFLI